MRSVSFQQTIGAVTHDIPLIWPRTSFGVLPSTSPLDDFLLLPRTSNMLNSSATYDGPPLPSYTLTPRPDLIPQIPEGTFVRVRYYPLDPDQNHTFAADNEGLLPVAVWSS